MRSDTPFLCRTFHPLSSFLPAEAKVAEAAQAAAQAAAETAAEEEELLLGCMPT